ncbi:porin family protein [Flavobacterium sp. PLA-1-15]|uniref:porin family protein n=1 Tax=Flavobacterium sp. PLA-1-15 TaxID=3380533 RepID=UPI003B79B652
MKKILLFTALNLFFFSTSNAQVTIKPGVKAGLNLSRFTNSDSDFRPDFYVGGLAEIKFSSFYALQPELVYSRQGATITYNDFAVNPSGGSVEKKYSLDYLSLGAINKFTFAERFQAVVGPTIDIQVADNFDRETSDDLIGLDLGLAIGLGYSLPNGLTFEARFKQGLIDIFGDNYNAYEDENNNGNYDEIVTNQVIQLGISYTFGSK